MIVLVDLPQATAISIMLLIRQPMLLRTVRREATIGTLELDVFPVSYMGMAERVRCVADRTRRELFDGLAPLLDGGER